MELTLTPWSDIPVLDKTGLNGKFTYDVRWVSNEPGPGRASGSLLIDAMEEQLGLTLRPHQEPTRVMIVDSIGRPTEN